jgi:hypothetical protein
LSCGDSIVGDAASGFDSFPIYYGSEFINSHFIRYCRENRLTFTRSRSNRKNDNCFVEQKNYSIVRRAVGYMR